MSFGWYPIDPWEWDLLDFSLSNFSLRSQTYFWRQPEIRLRAQASLTPLDFTTRDQWVKSLKRERRGSIGYHSSVLNGFAGDR